MTDTNNPIVSTNNPRSFGQAISYLDLIQHTTTNSKIQVVCEALCYGFRTARTNYKLESRLYRLPCLDKLVEDIANNWDGQDYISGALYVANHQYNDILE